MVRSTTPKIRDDRSFPIRILFKVPEMGLAQRIDGIHRWLHNQEGPANYAVQAAGRMVGHDRVAVYLRRLPPALELMDAFPDLELSDIIDEMEKAEARPARRWNAG